ncbi:NAD-dependent epimerase [uncultured Enterovirga sp.]|uniref:NAD-dependent epimerase n=1 Tax=uncultured Enterovirga sp. TaxID=2026352 RepID=UPI0035CA9BE9
MSGNVLVTGAAGFIGFHVCRRLLTEGRPVVGVDNLDPYYDVALKEARLAELAANPGFRFERTDLADAADTASLFRRHDPSLVIHLAAQPGVRHSLVDPGAYVGANVTAFLHVLEACRHGRVAHLVYASSSSVYGANTAMPFSTHRGADHQVSLYGATKKANEAMAHSYSHLFGLPATGLRFFTVYGPWGRPDMAMVLFTRAILEGRPIDLFNGGRMSRDFTYIDDVVEGVVRVAAAPPGPDPNWSSAAPDPATSAAPHRLFNLGGDAPVELGRVVALLEAELGRPALTHLMPMQPGDVMASWADVEDLARLTGFRPQVPIAEGIQRFVAWYRGFYGA